VNSVNDKVSGIKEIQTWAATAEILAHGSGTFTLYADAVEE
jgi:hypothetical protein